MNLVLGILKTMVQGALYIAGLILFCMAIPWVAQFHVVSYVAFVVAIMFFASMLVSSRTGGG